VALRGSTVLVLATKRDANSNRLGAFVGHYTINAPKYIDALLYKPPIEYVPRKRCFPSRLPLLLSSRQSYMLRECCRMMHMSAAE
jgi:hypothetical protein